MLSFIFTVLPKRKSGHVTLSLRICQCLPVMEGQCYLTPWDGPTGLSSGTCLHPSCPHPPTNQTLAVPLLAAPKCEPPGFFCFCFYVASCPCLPREVCCYVQILAFLIYNDAQRWYPLTQSSLRDPGCQSTWHIRFSRWSSPGSRCLLRVFRSRRNCYACGQMGRWSQESGAKARLVCSPFLVNCGV